MEQSQLLMSDYEIFAAVLKLLTQTLNIISSYQINTQESFWHEKKKKKKKPNYTSNCWFTKQNPACDLDLKTSFALGIDGWKKF